MLDVRDHRRDSAGLTYVYPVVSRRAGGVSVGINLNTNNACNWACVYCQVPNLRRGGPDPVNLDLLEAELRSFLREALEGDYLQRHVPLEARRLVDVAFSGNGEPTSAPEFYHAVDRVGQVVREFALTDQLTVRVITNGSLMHRPAVRKGIERIGTMNGEVWFKVDRVCLKNVLEINGVRRSPGRVREALLQCAERAPTWLQTCVFAMDGKGPDEEERSAYLALVGSVRDKIKGVHLYGIARPSLQPEAERLSGLSAGDFDRYVWDLAELGVRVVSNP